MASRQREWQKKRRAAGLCIQCGQDARGKERCDRCRAITNAGRTRRRRLTLDSAESSG